ncbi:MAG: hypothetical protein CMA64_02815, partial [Euryarchaeota archaeon]|nr:hypothetical protein [Euryarchaeota archaeon]
QPEPAPHITRFFPRCFFEYGPCVLSFLAIQPPLQSHGQKRLILDFKLKEEGQRIRYRRTLLASNVKRLRLSAMSQFAYTMKDESISSIEDRIALLTAKSDSLHSDDDVMLLSEGLPNSQLIEVPSNQFAHDAEVIPILEAFQDDN